MINQPALVVKETMTNGAFKGQTGFSPIGGMKTIVIIFDYGLIEENPFSMGRLSC